jgi:capsular polysaccharide transport system permease protein
MSATYIHTKRKAGLSILILRFLAILYFVTLVASVIYLWICTQDRYISTAEFKVSQQSLSGNEVAIPQLALTGLSDSGSADSQIVIGYVNSSDLLLGLEKEYNLVEHYQSPKIDFVFRLKHNANLEERLKYYRSRILAHFDMETGMTIIAVDTFDPQLSQTIARTLLKRAEDYINVVNQNIADQQLTFVRSEVERSAKKIDDLNVELITLQNENNFISPTESISATLSTVQKMKLEAFKSQAELATIERDSPNSPRIENLKSQLRSLEELMSIESAKLSGTEKDRLNQLLVRFKLLDSKMEFAVRLRSAAESMLEKTRLNAIARSRFLTVIQNPYLPEDVGMPRRPYATVTLLVLGGLLFFIFRAVTKSIFSMI